MTKREYRFYRDSSDGQLVRSLDGFTTQVYIDETGDWLWWAYEMTTAPLTSITRERAQEIAGEGVDLDASDAPEGAGEGS